MWIGARLRGVNPARGRSAGFNRLQDVYIEAVGRPVGDPVIGERR